MKTDFTKLPRLYIDRNFAANASLTLPAAQTHYLKNVLRLKVGDFARFFNGKDGEWLGSITAYMKTEGTITLKGKTREQASKPAPLHLVFSPIKKDRLDFMIEKAVELGVTDLHPVLTNRTDVRQINPERVIAQITEASEQCERMEIPNLHPLVGLNEKLAAWSGPELIWCSERGNNPMLSTIKNPAAFLIGPVGGFDDAENTLLGAQKDVKPVSLGENILRAETASTVVLGYAKMQAL